MKIAVTDGTSRSSGWNVVVERPIGNSRPLARTIPSPRLTFRPCRMPATIAAPRSFDWV